MRRSLEKALSVEQWFARLPVRQRRARMPADLEGFTRIVPPADRDWADPFAIERSGRYYVFFEEMPARPARRTSR